MNTLLVTAYTPGYRDVYERLAESCKIHGADLWAMPYESTGEWVRNGHVKPRVLMEAMLREDRRRPVCWVDADAELVAIPKALDSITGVDVAVCRLAPKEVLSGTVWIAPTPGAMWLLAAWQDACRASDVIWDQAALCQSMGQSRSPIKVGELCHSLCWIPGTSPPLKRGVPVIVHHQASREVRAGKRSL